MSGALRVALLSAMLLGAAAFQPALKGAFTSSHSSASFRAVSRPSLRKSVTGPVMFETKVFKKETFDFSVAPDPTSEDILRVFRPPGIPCHRRGRNMRLPCVPKQPGLCLWETLGG